MFDILFTADALVALLTLTFLEIILGIDNIIFISLAASKLPAKHQKKSHQYWAILSNAYTDHSIIWYFLAGCNGSPILAH